MNNLFSETLKKIRTERGHSQTQMGKQLFVAQSTVARWESGNRLPDAAMIAHISEVLDTDVNTLLLAAAKSKESPHIIIVDDENPILTDSLTVLDEVMPSATIRGFIWPQQAIEYAKFNQIALILFLYKNTRQGFHHYVYYRNLPGCLYPLLLIHINLYA